MAGERQWLVAGEKAGDLCTLSMATMELVDNAIILVIPGAMDAGLADPLFWGSLTVAMVIAGIVAFPVNRWLIRQGKGHALVHAHHGC